MHPTRNLAWMCALAVALAALLPTPNSPAAELKTSKERLSNKAADEQRVDNCRVPPEQRGTAPRPDCGEAAQSPDAVRRNGASGHRP